MDPNISNISTIFAFFLATFLTGTAEPFVVFVPIISIESLYEIGIPNNALSLVKSCIFKLVACFSDLFSKTVIKELMFLLFLLFLTWSSRISLYVNCFFLYLLINFLFVRF